MSEIKLEETIATAITRLEAMKTANVRTSFMKLLELYEEKEILAAEVGVYEGVNAKYMLLLKDKIKLHLIDAWDNCVIYTGGPKQSAEFCRLIRSIALLNLLGLQDKYILTNKNSSEAVKDYPDEYFDYVYIDGDHSKEIVKFDLRAWFPKVKKGGIFAGHDVGMPEVSEAVDEFVKEYNITNWNKDEENKKGRSDWWIYR